MDENPYKSPDAKYGSTATIAIRTGGSWMQKAVHVTAIMYPIVLVAAFYAAWLLAWGVLGHVPRASLDDPSETLGAIIYSASALPIILMPFGWIAAILTVASRFASPGSSRAAALALAILIISLWVGATAILRSDPIGVIYWWMD
jgi:hypothetical protein